VPPLEDLLAPDLDLVVCGTAASPVSAARRQYYAGPGNRFWWVLAEIGLTPEPFAPAEYRRLLELGIGLTDVVKDQSGVDARIAFGSRGSFLERRLAPFAPRWLCFNGKRAACEALGQRRVGYGVQTRTFGPTRLFVAPSTSAAARRSWDVEPWRVLARAVRGPDLSAPADRPGLAR
jgi:TDG/mug DNA glycosylase family protein